MPIDLLTGGALAPDRLATRTAAGLRFGEPLLTRVGRTLPSVTPVRAGYVRLQVLEQRTGQPLGLGVALDMLTDEEPRMLPDGYASGWETVSLPGRVNRLKWTGGDGLRQLVPITMDVLHTRHRDIEAEWQVLCHMARPPRGVKPPRLRVTGPVSHKDIDWVIVGFDIRDDTRRRGHKLVRQSVDITIGQWSETHPAGTLKRTRPARDQTSTVTVSSSRRTLKEIAKYYLNDAGRWRDIAKLNKGLNDPDRRLPVGTKIIIPGDIAAAGGTAAGTGGALAPSG